MRLLDWFQSVHRNEDDLLYMVLNAISWGSAVGIVKCKRIKQFLVVLDCIESIFKLVDYVIGLGRIRTEVQLIACDDGGGIAIVGNTTTLQFYPDVFVVILVVKDSIAPVVMECCLEMCFQYR